MELERIAISPEGYSLSAKQAEALTRATEQRHERIEQIANQIDGLTPQQDAI